MSRYHLPHKPLSLSAPTVFDNLTPLFRREPKALQASEGF